MKVQDHTGADWKSPGFGHASFSLPATALMETHSALAFAPDILKRPAATCAARPSHLGFMTNIPAIQEQILQNLMCVPLFVRGTPFARKAAADALPAGGGHAGSEAYSLHCAYCFSHQYSGPPYSHLLPVILVRIQVPSLPTCLNPNFTAGHKCSGLCTTYEV